LVNCQQPNLAGFKNLYGVINFNNNLGVPLRVGLSATILFVSSQLQRNKKGFSLQMELCGIHSFHKEKIIAWIIPHAVLP